MTGTALVPMTDLRQMAEAVAKSQLFGMKTAEQALALMLVAQAEGLHPATAARDYHIIQGRPTLKADAMLARFQQNGGVVEWVEYTDTKVSAKFSHHVNSPAPVLVEWTFEQAKKIGLTGKDNWKNYPRAMLRARVVSEGIRTVFPAVAVGVYTPEEAEEFKDINPAPNQKRQRRLPQESQEVQDVQPEGSATVPPSPESAAEGEVESAKLLHELSAKIDLAADETALKGIGKEITKEVKAKMLPSDVAQLREKYQAREQEMTRAVA